MLVDFSLLAPGIVCRSDEVEVILHRQVGDGILRRQRLVLVAHEVTVEVGIVVGWDGVEH